MKQRLQRKQTGGAPTAGAASSTAERGVSGPGTALPHADKIQASFGHHDLSGVQAHVGGTAAQATETLNAAAFAFGDDIAFSETPDLFTAAHEAAHVVCQRAGHAPAAETGEAGDSYEQLADAVAERVVAGESAQDLLDGVASAEQAAASPTVQRRELPEKQVSPTAMARLAHSRKAIDHTIGIMEAGRGNQYVDLQSSNFNSYFRMAAMRDPDCWILDPKLHRLASENPHALTTAKAGLAKAGNCGEYASLAMDFLRVQASGEQLHYSAKEGLDHAFVLIGDLEADSDADIVVADAWPTAPTACLWEDFFAYTSDRGQINAMDSLTGGGEEVATILAAGLQLSPKGLSYVNHSYSDEETEKALKEGTEGEKTWIWRHENTADVEYDYVGPQEDPALDLDLSTDTDVAPEVADAIESAPSQAPTTSEQSESAPEQTDGLFSRFISWIRSWL